MLGKDEAGPQREGRQPLLRTPTIGVHRPRRTSPADRRRALPRCVASRCAVARYAIATMARPRPTASASATAIEIQAAVIRRPFCGSRRPPRRRPAGRARAHAGRTVAARATRKARAATANSMARSPAKAVPSTPGARPLFPRHQRMDTGGQAERGGLSKMAAAPALPLRAGAPPLGETGTRRVGAVGPGETREGAAPRRDPPRGGIRLGERRTTDVAAAWTAVAVGPPSVIRGRSGRRLRRRARSSARGRRRRAVHRCRSIGAWRSASFGGKNRQERRHSTGVQRKREPKQSAR